MIALWSCTYNISQDEGNQENKVSKHTGLIQLKSYLSIKYNTPIFKVIPVAILSSEAAHLLNENNLLPL